MVASELRRFHGKAPAIASLLWRLSVPMLVASTAPVGGGIGMRRWVMNVQVPAGYVRRDIDAHIDEVRRAFGLPGPGVGMLTAADVSAGIVEDDEEGVRVEATVGLSLPIWAAAPSGVPEDTSHAAAEDGSGLPGTINIVAFVGARHRDAALANLLCTVTEAKAQALGDGGIPGTGTASDAVTVICPAEGQPEPFGGPRSTYGAPIARAVYAALRAGIGSSA
jgi:adenosylcobinamide hydrolase